MADIETPTVPAEVRGRLALAIDVDDLVLALRIGRQLRPYFGVAKVGLELYSAAGPEVIGSLTELGFEVFLDLKLHDIPTTVGKAARVLGALGVSYVTLHAHGGPAMLRAGVDGLREGASKAGLPDPWSLAITVLTSDSDAPPHIMPKRVLLAAEAGCTGIVCAGDDLKDAYEYAPRLKRVVPGIRLAGTERHEQRASTPSEALAGGADLLVIGRTVTAAPDPVAAAEQLVGEVLGAAN
jgi:orotidine-5'-phosphate decarboxylase